MTTASTFAIQASGLVKKFGTTRAVDGIDLAVSPGGVFGLLGPNGAGKTTTIRIFATLTSPDSGTASVLGHDVTTAPDAVRGRISLTGQFATIDNGLTGMENMVLQARLLGFTRRAAVRRATELLEAFDLSQAARRAVKTYSGGMKRRLDIAASIVVTPELLFLDEPTTGLDPQSRNRVWEMVRQLVGRGTTVLLTTQYLEEADRLSDRIAVIDHGRIIADGTPGQLKASVGAGVLRIRLDAPAERDRARRTLAAALGVAVHAEPDPAALTARIEADALDQGAGATVARAMTYLVRDGIKVSSFALGEPSLDEVFLALTGHDARQTDNQQEVA